MTFDRMAHVRVGAGALVALVTLLLVGGHGKATAQPVVTPAATEVPTQPYVPGSPVPREHRGYGFRHRGYGHGGGGYGGGGQPGGGGYGGGGGQPGGGAVPAPSTSGGTTT